MGLPASAKVSAVLLRSNDSGVADYLEEVSPAPCQKILLKAPLGDYTLLINDQATNRQFKYALKAQGGIASTTVPGAPTTLSMPKKPPEECGNGVCAGAESAESCCIDCGCVGAERCINGACEGVDSQKDNAVYYVGAGILLIIIGFIAYLKRPKSREAKR
jgi:hypothetical protein